MKKKIIIIIAVLVLLLIVGGIGTYFFIIKNKDIEDIKEIGKMVKGIPECGTKKDLLTNSPIDLKNVTSIIPLGNLNPSGHTFPTDHMYLNIIPNTEKIPVYAPGDVWITQIHSQEHLWADSPYTDYSLHFSPCREFDGYFIHIMSLSEKLQKEFDKKVDNEDCIESNPGGRRHRMCFADVSIKVSAGEQIGTVGGHNQANFDLGASDSRIKPLDYINPSRWQWRGDSLYVVCPLDYFVNDLKEELYSLVGDFDEGKRTIEPICGEVMQDVRGTAQGVWFAEGTGGLEGEDPHIALVHDNINPTIGVFSIGTSMEDKGLPSSTYNFTPTHSGFFNRDFDEVTPDGNTYCYQAQGGYSGQHTDYTIILGLLDDKTIRIEGIKGGSCGTGPWEFSSNYVEFVR